MGAAIDLMQRYSISQLPVVRNEPAESLADVVGSLQERGVLDRVFKNPDALNEDVAALMQPPLAAVDVGDSLDQVFADLSGPSAAVVVAAAGRPAAILTQSDLLEYLAHQRSQVTEPWPPAFSERTATKTEPTISAAPAATASVSCSSSTARRAGSRRAGSRTGA